MRRSDRKRGETAEVGRTKGGEKGKKRHVVIRNCQQIESHFLNRLRFFFLSPRLSVEPHLATSLAPDGTRPEVSMLY